MNRFEKVAVIGAAGKMGRGIALILLQEMARRDAEDNGSVGKNGYRLVLIDTDEEGVFGLRQDFRPHLTRFAEKSINQIRSYFYDRKDLIENAEIIYEFVEGALDIIRPSTELKVADNSFLVFEAAVEDFDLKTELFRTLKDNCPSETYFFTNTSSIPITELGESSGLDGRLVGAHFYNPPPVQKLLELIFPEGAEDEAKELAMEIGKSLGKVTVVSKDVAGFIGNGHFIREIAFACDLYERLRKERSHVEAVLMVDTVTRDFLIRPMGIFQLLDYVGLDVWKRIALIMEEKVPLEGSVKPLLSKMVDEGKIGGQERDGSQKEGFFRYQKNKIDGVYDLEKGTYVEPPNVEEFLGPLPEHHLSWKKALNADKEKLKKYEEALCQADTLGAEMAAEFLNRSREAANELVETGVAESIDDVKTVLKNGFYHVLV